MSVLFANVTALTMDPARPVVENAFVAVKGTKIVSVGTVRPEGTFDRVVEADLPVAPPRPGWTTGPWPPERPWAWPR